MVRNMGTIVTCHFNSYLFGLLVRTSEKLSGKWWLLERLIRTDCLDTFVVCKLSILPNTSPGTGMCRT